MTTRSARYFRRKKEGYYSIPLSSKIGHATFVGKPSKETIEAVNAMAELAYKMKFKN